MCFFLFVYLDKYVSQFVMTIKKFQSKDRGVIEVWTFPGTWAKTGFKKERWEVKWFEGYVRHPEMVQAWTGASDSKRNKDIQY